MSQPHDDIPTSHVVALVGGHVIDGSGAPARRADVVIEGDCIVAVGPAVEFPASAQVRPVPECVITPGFIDLHTHADFTVPRYPSADSMIRQGVTTILTGNCGSSPYPVGEGERGDMLRANTAMFGADLEWSWNDLEGYLTNLENLTVVPNVATLVGHGSVRMAAMGGDDRPASESELQAMCDYVDAAMAAGAFGMSTGLIYPPGAYASEDEIIALARVVAKYDGFMSTHMRNEGHQLIDAMHEAFRIAGAAGIGLQLSHHKVLGATNHGRTVESLALIDRRRAEGLDVTADFYPYLATSTNLSALLPGWALSGSPGQMQARLADPVQRAAIRAEVIGPRVASGQYDPNGVVLASVEGDTSGMAGRRLTQIAAERGLDPVDTLFDLLAEHGTGISMVNFAIGAEDLVRVMSHPLTSVASDGWTLHPDSGGKPHPRSYGTFSSVISDVVGRDGILTLPEAIRKMTSLPAARLGLTNRGLVAEGMRADLVVFDPDAVTTPSTFEDPHRFAEGFEAVYVNGRCVVDRDRLTGDRPGTVLRANRG